MATLAPQKPVVRDVVRLITPHGTWSWYGVPGNEPGVRPEPYVTLDGTRVHEILQEA